MKPNEVSSPTAATPRVPHARLSAPHGYRFDGDQVKLQARLTVLNREAYSRSWSLQLWASRSAPASLANLDGQLVAEATLPPMSEAADESLPVDVTTFARLPAGADEWFLTLALVAKQAGQSDQIHDTAVYPRTERFVQPRMRGTIDYRMEGDRVAFSVEHIENPRSAANCSGTLAVELWALAASYQGGDFQGRHLAGVEIGTLFGQTEIALSSIPLPFSAPPAGTWHFVLMLCEWTSAGYVIRDYLNFTEPVIYRGIQQIDAHLTDLASAAPADGSVAQSDRVALATTETPAPKTRKKRLTASEAVKTAGTAAPKRRKTSDRS